jgi:carboxylesterase type B
VQSIPTCSHQSNIPELLVCLRSLSASSVNAASNKVLGKIESWLDLPSNLLPWTPVVDGDEFPDQVLDVFSRGKQHNVPLLIGTNQNELDFFLDHLSTFIGKGSFELPGEFDAAAFTFFGLINAVKVMHKYPANDFDDAKARIARTATDWLFLCSNQRLALMHSKIDAPVFLYRFDHSPAQHGAELPFVFGMPANANISDAPNNLQKGLALRGDNHKAASVLAQIMGESWSSFAAVGKPTSGTASFEWKPFNGSSGDFYTTLNTGNATHPYVTTEGPSSMCNFWDDIGYLYQAPWARMESKVETVLA